MSHFEGTNECKRGFVCKFCVQPLLFRKGTAMKRKNTIVLDVNTFPISEATMLSGCQQQASASASQSVGATHTATVSLLPADPESSRLDPSGSPPPALAALWPAGSHPPAEQGKPPSLAQVSPGIHQARPT
jgi:hypothetical protein